MKLPRARHRWNLTPKQAIRLQKRLATEIEQVPLCKSSRLVAGSDAAFTPDGEHIIAGWVVWDIQAKAVVDSALARRPVRFPYVPGLLSFREAPALIAAARKLTVEPDVFMFDGQGLAHPRRLGLACHVGLLIDRPSLGCAKSRLCGTPAPKSPRSWPGGTNKQEVSPQPRSALLQDILADTAGASCPLIHNGERIGRILRTREGVKPIYVSIGHKITLKDATRLTLRCCTKYRLPEPTRLAHQFVTRHRHTV